MNEQPQVTIFNIGENREAMNDSMFRKKFESHMFDPKLKNIQDTDSFIIRPLPYVKDPLHSLVNKSFYALQDELGVFIFDSRTTFNRPAEGYYQFCEPSDLWLKLRNSKDPNISRRTEQLRKQQSNVCYVQIVNYPKDPSLNGQIRPFRLPTELVKAMNQMANPTEQQRALGAIPVQPFDMFKGKNITCSIVGHMEGSTLMRKWTVTVDQISSEVRLPLGPNGEMIEISKCSQESVVALFNEKMQDDLTEQYGYHEPSVQVKQRMKNYLRRLVSDIPVLLATVESYFPDLANLMKLDQESIAPQQPQPAQQPVPQPVTGTVADGYASVAQQQGQQAQPAPQPQPVTQPQPVQQPQQAPQTVAQPVQMPTNIILP